jgi:hypothetical protein
MPFVAFATDNALPVFDNHPGHRTQSRGFTVIHTLDRFLHALHISTVKEHASCPKLN